LFGFLIGWFRGGSAKYLSMPLSVAFWVSGFFITWWCMEAGSRVVSRLAGRWLPLSATLLTGAMLGLVLARPGLGLRLEIFRPHFGGWLPDYAAPPPGGVSWLDWVQFATPILLVWMASNWVYFVPLSMRRFGRTAALERAFWLGRPRRLDASSLPSSMQAPAAIPIEPAATGAATPLPAEEPATIASLGLSVREVVALEADDHYTRVFLRQGSRYLRAQFGHLLQQMPRPAACRSAARPGCRSTRSKPSRAPGAASRCSWSMASRCT
jgi:hypothetical protein